MAASIEKLLFAIASSLTDAEELRAFLAHVCRDDEALHLRLEALLNLRAEAERFFDGEPSGRIADSPQTESEGDLGVMLDRYRLIRRLGAGGCGVVYLAEQETPVRRKVAVKIVKPGMDTESVIARFDAERQALAQMDHPNIARVLDAGATYAGRPFFVMELVDGQRITDFCDARCLDLRQRAALFIQVCQAIHHAHQKGVIHRDIKPSNVLVRVSEGIPMPTVIDFGIAKATAEGGDGPALTRTPSDHFLGTPAYMSPEQARGDIAPDTRTDIYSLGVLLYELLSGLQPFDLERLKKNGTGEIRRIICEQEPVLPSLALKRSAPNLTDSLTKARSTDLRHLVSALAGDLDWVVMKALEKERARRYESAAGLAMDVERYLNDEPVLARPPSRGYRLGKLVRRNKLVFAASGIAIFALLAGFIVSTWMFFREREARQEQARLRENAELRGLVDRAAVRINYQDLAEADRMLSAIPLDAVPSSLEAANAYRAVAGWHLAAGRLKEASTRMGAMAHAISNVDDSDEPTVSLAVMNAAILAAYAGETAQYEEIRRMAIRRFGRTSNPVVAEEILKACLVLPADAETLRKLQPMSVLVEKAIEAKEGLTGTNPRHLSAGCYSLAIWYYRTGNSAKTAEWVKRAEAVPYSDVTREIAIQSVRSLAGGDAVPLEPLRKSVEKAFSNRQLLTSPSRQPFPANWLNADILLGEAERARAAKRR